MYKRKHNISICIFIILLAFFLPLQVFAEEQSQKDETWQKVEKTKVLTWGTDPEGGAPFSFFNPKNPTELIGFEVEIIRKIAEKLGVKEKMIQNDWDALVSGLKRKNFDIIISGLEITEPRKQEINFSRPYYIYTQQLVVRKDNTTIKDPEDLKKKGIKVGTLSAAAALNILVGMGLSPGQEIKIYPSVVGAYKDLENNRIDAVLLELTIAAYYAKPNPLLKYAGEPFGKGYYGIGIRKDNPELLKRINKALGELMAEGEIEKICRKWDLWNDKQKELLDFKENNTGVVSKQTTWQRAPVEVPLLLKAALVTIKICVISMIFAIMLGLTIAILRIYAPLPFRFLCAAYVELFRGTPLLIQLYIIYYGLPQIGVRLEAFTAAVIGLSLNYAAYESENYRAGIKSIPKGQMEAALALGMTKTMALRKIIIPQAIKVVIPPVTNDFIAMFKDSSIVSIITMVELTKQYNYLASVSYDYIGLGLITAAIYFLMSYPASVFARSIEKKLSNER